MILGLSLHLFMGWLVEKFVLLSLFFSVGCLSIAVIYFLLDVSLAVKAMRVELVEHLQE